MEKLIEKIDEIYLHMPKNVNLYLLSEKNLSDDRIMMKYQNAVKNYVEFFEDEEIPLFLFDDTLFGSAKEGFLITTKSIYFKESYEDANSVQFTNFTSKVTFEEKKISMGNKSLALSLLNDNTESIVAILNTLIEFSNTNENTSSTEVSSIIDTTENLKSMYASKITSGEIDPIEVSFSEFEQLNIYQKIWDWAEENNLSDSIIPRKKDDLFRLNSLQLSNKNLKSIPKEIGGLINLTKLYLESNSLKNIPKEIGNLYNLIELHLYKNQLTHIPQELANLSKLSSLYLSSNNLVSLPIEIYNILALKSLGLSNNEFSELPKNIGNLINLKWLNLGDNKLTKLPNEIESFIYLEKFYLPNNKLLELPNEIGKLVNLIELHLDFNQLTKLPSEIKHLTKLAVLDLSNNQFSTKPEELSELVNLKKLILDNNPLEVQELKQDLIKKRELENQRNKQNKSKDKNSKKNINLFIKDNVKSIGKNVYLAPNIPPKKLNNAIKAMKCENFYNSIVAIQDGTMLGSSDEGFVFTGEKMIHHKYGTFFYSEIDSVEYKRDVSTDKNGQKKTYEYILISKNGRNHKLGFLYDINKRALSTFLNKIIINFEEYKEENQQPQEVSTMPDELKIAYLKIIIIMTYIDDEEIDAKELAELFSLMTKIDLRRETRFKIRAYIAEISSQNLDSIESLLVIMKNNSEVSQHKPLMISLVKDLINVYFSTKATTNRDFKFLDEHKDLFELSDTEINLVYYAIEIDYKILKEDLDDTAIEKNAKELASKAAAAGVPIAAVYISGSVIGMSAAGITSGLATLGMGLGMTGGIAVIGLVGILSYKGVKHLTGANELDKYKAKEIMLHDIIKLSQKTISLIIDDVNYIVQKLNDTILNHSEETQKIKKHMQMVAQFQGALKSVDNNSSLYQNSVMRLQSPKILDNERFKSLTEEPTKQPLYDFVIENYELKIITINNENVKRFVLKENVKTEILDKMAEIFKTLGYFDMDNILKSKASGMIKGFFG